VPRSPLVIAHRGACGYLPEHTAEAKVLAFAMGADYLEQDVVASRDGTLLVLHDIYLEAVTDVANQFPNRARGDGHFYAIDFDWVEIRSLRVGPRRNADNDLEFPGRYRGDIGEFRIHTFAEELELVAELNRQFNREVGVYAEIKAPQWHHAHDCDLTSLVIQCLQQFGYQEHEDPAFVQCFDPDELWRARTECGSNLKLIQLMGTGTEDGVDYELMATPAGLTALATRVDGLGPSLHRLVDAEGMPTGFTAQAQQLGLAVHPYTFRADRLPHFSDNLATLLRLFLDDVGVDGVFCDFPDQAVRVRDAVSQT
jgi:glycerophosphoryl diester phosphodiesterase